MQVGAPVLFVNNTIVPASNRVLANYNCTVIKEGEFLYQDIRSNFQYHALPPSECQQINPHLHFLGHGKRNGNLHGPDKDLDKLFYSI